MSVLGSTLAAKQLGVKDMIRFDMRASFRVVPATAAAYQKQKHQTNINFGLQEAIKHALGKETDRFLSGDSRYSNQYGLTGEEQSLRQVRR